MNLSWVTPENQNILDAFEEHRTFWGDDVYTISVEEVDGVPIMTIVEDYTKKYDYDYFSELYFCKRVVFFSIIFNVFKILFLDFFFLPSFLAFAILLYFN